MIITAVDAVPFSCHTMQIEELTVSNNSAIKRAFLPGLLISLAHYCIVEAQGKWIPTSVGKSIPKLIDMDIGQSESSGLRDG